MRGNVWLQIQIWGVGVFWNVGISIRLASWINHVTCHVLTMVIYLSQ